MQRFYNILYCIYISIRMHTKSRKHQDLCEETIYRHPFLIIFTDITIITTIHIGQCQLQRTFADARQLMRSQKLYVNVYLKILQIIQKEISHFRLHMTFSHCSSFSYHVHACMFEEALVHMVTLLCLPAASKSRHTPSLSSSC